MITELNWLGDEFSNDEKLTKLITGRTIKKATFDEYEGLVLTFDKDDGGEFEIHATGGENIIYTSDDLAHKHQELHKVVTDRLQAKYGPHYKRTDKQHKDHDAEQAKEVEKIHAHLRWDRGGW